jgi:hypothetical protein
VTLPTAIGSGYFCVRVRCILRGGERVSKSDGEQHKKNMREKERNGADKHTEHNNCRIE